ncbi:MAG: hypothetical protein R3B13_13250 [Polyangiaceae bacterium]
MTKQKAPEHTLDLDGLLCALVLAPRTFARNRFFELYKQPSARRVRRRAARVRGIIRHLMADGRPQGEIVGEQVLADGQVLLRLRVPDLAFERTTALTALEAATLRYAIHRAGKGPLDPVDKEQVELALSRLGPSLDS